MIALLMLGFITSKGQIINYSASYGIVYPEIQFAFEAQSQKIDRLSSGLKWKWSKSAFKGLFVEGFGRLYMSSESKSDSQNDHIYLQGKVGYAAIKQKGDAIFSIKDQNYYTYLTGIGIGNKFLWFEKVTFDVYLGYNYIKAPVFNTLNTNYNQISSSNWKTTIGFPLDFQWSLGFIID